MKKIPVMEIFGPTIQGEGMVIGRKTMFVRTAGCDYQCKWCDSAFTWDGTGKDDIQLMTGAEILEELEKIGSNCFDHVTISGGNPALLSSLGELISLLKERSIEVALETQGSKWQPWFTDIDDLTISPKPPSSGMNTDFTVLDEIVSNLQALHRNFSLKVVVFDERDFEYAKEIKSRYDLAPFFLQVGNEDIKTENTQELIQTLLAKYEWLISKTIESPEMNAARVLPQLHAFVWGNKRGV
ncbi:7-carboxy-7-deazaguanine synthase QueE [Bacillus salitolerans]|uniref:7-carboxy-7-deazaguanine synthase n=1 Tax=Bacillus salitolerans TaxID=1437434 RepID=A0ABW4LX56_9BACI